MDARLRRLWILSGLLLVLGGGALFAMRACLRGIVGQRQTEPNNEDPLAPFGEVGAFDFVERSGRRVTRGDLDGKVWIACFFFTSCGGICPVMTRNLTGLQDLLHQHEDLRFVSLSCDPVRDTPARLSAYAEEYGADPVRWLFLTGPAEAMQAFAKDSLRLAYRAASEEELAEGAETTLHSDRFLLIDRAGRLRAAYHGTDPADVARLRADLPRVLSEPSDPEERR